MPPYIATVMHRCGHSDIYLTPHQVLGQGKVR